MKYKHVILIFSIIVSSYFLLNYVKVQEVVLVTDMQRQYNRALNNAVDDALSGLVEIDATNQVVINKDQAVESFFQSLQSSFGNLNDKNKQQLLRLYVPVFLVTDMDGYYIYFFDMKRGNNGELLYEPVWTEKKPYFWEHEGYLYHFSLSGNFKVLRLEDGNVVEGNRMDIAAAFPENRVLKDKDWLEEERKKAIINAIQADMESYIDNHNRIAQQFGITYHFSLPYINNADWYNTIEDISIMAVFQGYPYLSSASFGTFNKYALGGSGLVKQSWYYITTQDDILYYHKGKCKMVTDKSEPFYSREECAKRGAYPCMECHP